MPFLDLITCVLLFFGDHIPVGPLRFFSMYLIAKGIFFTMVGRDIPSFLDFLIGIYGLTIVFLGWYSVIISIIAIVFLGQKALVAFA